MFFGGYGMIIILLIIVVAIVAFIIIGKSKSYQIIDRGHTESAIDILKQRYAKGEISEEEFEKMKKKIL
ncbi:SHOCT domain-containing protein [Deferribacteraceae bacterium V6Fe1]|nr:SHOCT domain-containing protein [Deferribacteraceae bacterium V6Fe1]